MGADVVDSFYVRDARRRARSPTPSTSVEIERAILALAGLRAGRTGAGVRPLRSPTWTDR